VYVGDIILAGNDSSACIEFKTYLNSCFRIKVLGPLKYFLGIEATRGPRGLFLSQRKYALEIINDCGMLGSKPTAFLMEEHHKLALAQGQATENASQYQRLVGTLIYVTPKMYTIHCLHSH